VDAFLIVLAGVYGLVIGSFLNAWAYRLAHGEKITVGRSACPVCHHEIRAFDNVPLVSWMVLKGRCRDCGAAISWRYPVGEGVTAVLFAAVAAMDGFAWLLVPHLVFVSVMLLVSQVDLDKRIIPDIIILPAAAIGVPLMIVLGDGAWWSWPVAGLAAAGFLFLISEVYYRLRHVEGMGLGDVKMALCMGVYLGAAVVPALFLGFLGGAAVGLVVIAARRGDAKTALPFGPFLAAGAITALFVGHPLIDAYLGLALGGR